MLLRTLPLFAACLIAAAPSHAADPAAPPAPRPALESFFENPAFSTPLLSPNAKFLAVRVGGNGKRERLAVLDVEHNTAKVVAGFEDVDIGHMEWVNDNRLVFDTIDHASAPGDQRYAPGLYAVNRDGSEFLQLVSRGRDRSQGPGMRALLPFYTKLVPAAGKQDSEFVYVESPNYTKWPNVQYVDLLKLNTLNGRVTPVMRPGPVQSWLLDQNGEPRLAVTVEKNVGTVWYRDPASGAWRVLQSSGLFEDTGATPLAFGPDGTLYVRSREGGDKSAIYAYDLANRKVLPKAVAAIDGYDFSGALVADAHKLLGVNYVADAAGTYWFDDRMAAIQKAVDALLPDTVNLIGVTARAEAPIMLVTSFSDVKPAVFRLFNHKDGTLNPVGKAFPKIDAAAMGHQAMVRYKARDGLEIPAYLTLPAGGARKDLPMVVLVHGGPYVRGGHWGWKPDTQFLASRGYAVLEPDYRGSTGYGQKHFRAGWKQWGLAMQDDIADGARWAIAQGIADPKRICIAGASYGGYATLMGLVNDPDLYKCGVEWAGVADIGLLFSGHWSFESDLRDSWKDYGMPLLVGDPVADAAQFKATSPIEQAARIRQPLMLAYGTADKRVPIYHGTQLRDALKATNAQVEWVQYEEEGHGWSLPKNRIDFWSRVEKFLDRNIGKP